jgi:DNA-binding transcriptional LysR family regulator
VRLLCAEHEPAEALDLLATDGADLALVYDYNLAPIAVDSSLAAIPLWSTAWGLAVPAAPPGSASSGAVTVFTVYRDHDWIVNSRNTADDQVVRVIGSMAGFEPRITHRADSLDLVQDLVAAGLGVGLLPGDVSTRPGVEVLRLADPDVQLRCYAVVRRGRERWPPLALVLDELLGRAR